MNFLFFASFILADVAYCEKDSLGLFKVYIAMDSALVINDKYLISLVEDSTSSNMEYSFRQPIVNEIIDLANTFYSYRLTGDSTKRVLFDGVIGSKSILIADDVPLTTEKDFKFLIYHTKDGITFTEKFCSKPMDLNGDNLIRGFDKEFTACNLPVTEKNKLHVVLENSSITNLVAVLEGREGEGENTKVGTDTPVESNKIEEPNKPEESHVTEESDESEESHVTEESDENGEPIQPEEPNPAEPIQREQPINPEEPIQPEEPIPAEPIQSEEPHPAEPIQPEEPHPAEPIQPEEPHPAEPIQPEEPHPAEPIQPEEPNKPEESNPPEEVAPSNRPLQNLDTSTGNSNDGKPDDSKGGNLLTYAIYAAVAFVCFIGVYLLVRIFK